MGYRVSLRCPCGYGESDLPIGLWFHSVPPWILGQCPICARISSGQEGSQMRCPSCRGLLSPIPMPMTAEPDDGELIDEPLPLMGAFEATRMRARARRIDFDAMLSCPRCGAMTLAIQRARPPSSPLVTPSKRVSAARATKEEPRPSSTQQIQTYASRWRRFRHWANLNPFYSLVGGALLAIVAWQLVTATPRVVVSLWPPSLAGTWEDASFGGELIRLSLVDKGGNISGTGILNNRLPVSVTGVRNGRHATLSLAFYGLMEGATAEISHRGHATVRFMSQRSATPIMNFQSLEIIRK